MRTRSSTAAWNKIRSFLDECFVVREPLMARLDVQRPQDSSVMDSLADRFLDSFGLPISGHDTSVTYLNWFLDEAQLDEALSMIDSLPETFLDAYGRQLVHVIIKMSQPKLKDSESKVLPNQGGDRYLGFEGEPDRILGENYFDAELGKNNFLYTFLSLPFDEPDTEFRDYVEFLRARFPCAMSGSAWKKWTLAKSGRSYVGRKFKLGKGAIVSGRGDRAG